jgi:hypothetical protein
VFGTGKPGLTLTCETGKWKAQPPPSFSYQWFREGAAIAGAIEKTYQVQIADQGHLITCAVTASNIEGRVEVESINGIPIPGPGHGAEGLQEVHGPEAAIPSPGVIIASLRRQLTTALEGAHLKSVLKHGFAFSFNPPTTGTLQVMFYRRYRVKPAHGSKHARYGYTLLGLSGKMAYASTKSSTVRVKLTPAGKAALKGKRTFGVFVKAIFTVPGKSPVNWAGTIVLS